MNTKTFLTAGLAAALAWWFVRRAALYDHEVRKATGVQAALDAATFNGYTTYNTQLYTPPLFQPLVRFFKAGAYVPPSTSGQAPAPVNYSVQG
jgi:hypothetical protein